MTGGRALVVGAPGFLGRHVCAALAAAGWQVTGASRRPVAGAGLDGTVRLPAARPVRTCLAAALAETRPALVVNAAGLIWRHDPDGMRAANADLPEQVALAVADAGGTARLVHLGSCLEYGPVEPPTAIDEGAPVRPLSLYGRTKLDGCRRACAVADRYRLDLVVLRVFNAIGAGMSTASLLGGVVDGLLRARRDGRTAVIELTDQRQYRDYVDARDVARAVLATASATGPGRDARIINIGSSVPRSADEVVRRLAAVSAVAHEIRTVPAPPGADRTAGASWQRAATGRAAAVLGWTARIPLADTLRHIWAAACPDASFPAPSPAPYPVAEGPVAEGEQ